MRRVVISGFLVAALAGCGGSVPSPSPAGSTAASPPPVAATSPSPSPSPVASAPSPSAVPTPEAVPTLTPRSTPGPGGGKWTRVKGSALVAPDAVAARAGDRGVLLLGGGATDGPEGGCQTPERNARGAPASFYDARTHAISRVAGNTQLRWFDTAAAGSTFFTVWAIPTGGWDAAQAFWSDMSDDSYLEGPALWHSDDGLSWSLLRSLPAEPDQYCYGAYPWAVVGPDGRRVLIGGIFDDCEEGEQGTSLSSSIDGREYQPLDAARLEYWDFMTGALAPAGSGPWVFVGGRCAGTCVPVGWSRGKRDDRGFPTGSTRQAKL